MGPTAAAAVTALSADTGSSHTDFITDVASQTVSGTYTGTLGSGDTIQVSVDGGAHWINATSGAGTWSASGVTLSAGTGTIQVQTINTSGSLAGTSHGFTLDTTIATPTVALTNDTGSSSSDIITNDAALTVSAAAVDVTRSYSRSTAGWRRRATPRRRRTAPTPWW